MSPTRDRNQDVEVRLIAQARNGNQEFFLETRVVSDTSGKFEWVFSVPDSVRHGRVTAVFRNCLDRLVAKRAEWSQQEPRVQFELVYCSPPADCMVGIDKHKNGDGSITLKAVSNNLSSSCCSVCLEYG